MVQKFSPKGQNVFFFFFYIHQCCFLLGCFFACLTSFSCCYPTTGNSESGSKKVSDASRLLFWFSNGLCIDNKSALAESGFGASRCKKRR